MPAEQILRAIGEVLRRAHGLQPLAGGTFLKARRSRERSLDLLLRCLTPAQRADFRRSKSFEVRGKSGQRYRINYGTTANIDVLEPSGAVSRRLCAAPEGVPIPAAMLAQKLMLEAREAEFLRIAARGPGTTAVFTALHT